MPNARTDLMQGTLELLILKTLSHDSMHGYGIAQRIHRDVDDLLKVEDGSLYPALKRLEAKGWIASKWETSEHNRRAKYYRLTPMGRKQLMQEHSKWSEFVKAVADVMGATPAGIKR